jgi:hypothetical protein
MTDQTHAPDPYEVAAQEAIAACGGDTHAALKAALIAMTMLEAEVCELNAATSKGYARGRLPGRGAA